MFPIVAVAAILAFSIAAASVGFVPGRPRLWSAAVALVVLAGITPLIYAVNSRIVPVFSRRDWQRPPVLYAAMLLAVAGGWLVYLGRALPSDALEVAGHGAALSGGILFVVSLIWLFRSPATARPAPPLPYPEQATIDRIGTRFTRLAGIYLLVGLSIGFVTSLWTPERGRWDLVWAHTLLVGWFLMMASGVLYHVLSRWTGARWRHPRLIRAHFVTVAVGLPLMVVALALDLDRLFAVAGPLQAAALILFVWNIAPLVAKLPSPSRLGLMLAVAFLVIGVSLGASAAMDPVNHTRLRFSHATINLLGWASLLICAVGYYLFPRFAGQPLRWPRLARIQLAAHAIGVTLTATAWWWYLAIDDGAQPLITAGALLVAASFTTFAGIVAGTFQHTGSVVSSITLQPRRSSQPR